MALVCLIAAYGFLCFTHLDRPGLFEDEALFPFQAVAFQQGRPPMNDDARWEKLFMPVPYLGGMRTLLYLMLFSRVEPSASAIRGFSAGTGLLILLLVFALAGRLLGKWAGVAAVLLLVADPTFFVGIRNDRSTVGLGLVLCISAVLSLLHWWRTDSVRSGALGSGLLGLMVWNQALSALVLLSMFLAATATFGPAFFRRLRSRARQLPIFGAAAVLGALPPLRHAFKNGFQIIGLALDPSFKNAGAAGWGLEAVARKNFDLMLQVFTGQRIQHFVSGDLFPARSSLFVWVIAAAALWWVRHMARAKNRSTVFEWLGWYALISTVLFLAVPPAYSHHHILLVFYPWVPLMVVAAFHSLVDAPQAAPAKAASLAVCGLCGVLFNLPLTIELRGRFARDLVHPRFSRQVKEDLRGFLQGEGARVIPIDWGFARTMVLQSGGRLDVANDSLFIGLDGSEASPAARENLALELERGDGLFVLHSPAYTHWARARRNFFDVLHEMGREPVLVHTIDSNALNRRVFEIYRMPDGGRL